MKPCIYNCRTNLGAAMITLVKVYRVIRERRAIQENVYGTIRSALGEPLVQDTLARSIDRLVSAKLIAGTKHNNKWAKVWALPVPDEATIGAMQPMMRAYLVYTILQLQHDVSLEVELSWDDLKASIKTHFPFLNTETVMERMYRGGMVKKPSAGNR